MCEHVLRKQDGQQYHTLQGIPTGLMSRESSAPRSAPLFTEVRGRDAILNYIFNPGGFIGTSMPPPARLGPDATPASISACTPAASEEDAKWTAEEKKAVELAEAGDLSGALAVLDTVISDAPTRATAYNNRAQVYRMMDNLPKALEDLNEAIKVAEKWLADHADASVVEVNRGKSVCQNAYLQRSAVRKAMGDDEAAHADVEKSASYGHRIARMMAADVRTLDFCCVSVGWSSVCVFR